MYLKNKVEIEPKIAGLLCSAIVSDTLLFRSPTCTPVDEMAARSLAAIAGLDIEKYAMEMFGAGSNLKDKSDEEIFYQDFKKFSVGKALIGVGQITSLNDIELGTLKEKMLGYMEKARESNSLDMVFFMLTNILKESTDLICYGQGAVQLAAKAFHLDIDEAGADAGGAGLGPVGAGGLSYVKGILETRQHALPGAGCHGQLRQGGRDTQHHYSGLGRHHLLGSRHGVHIRAQGAFLPQHHQGYRRICHQSGE